MTELRYANLVLRFVLELCALTAIGHWGIVTGDGPLMKAVLCIGGLLVVVVVWGMFVAPKARMAVPAAVRLGVEALVFGAAIVALLATDHVVLAAVFTCAVVVHRTLMFAWGQSTGRPVR